MLDAPKTLPSDPEDLRETAEGLLDIVKAQALRMKKAKPNLIPTSTAGARTG